MSEVETDTDVDWTGVAPDMSPIPPLTAETFVQRLAAMEDAYISVETLRAAFVAQHPQYADPHTDDPSGTRG